MSKDSFQSEYHKKLLETNVGEHAWDTLTGARELLRAFCEDQPPKKDTLGNAYSSWLIKLWEESGHDENKGRRTIGNGVSPENWRLKRKHSPSSGKSLKSEHRVEVAIADAIGPCWCGNAVAVNSGLLGQERRSNRGRQEIDIIRLCEGDEAQAELIELKYFKEPEKPTSGLAMLVGAAFQAALYALSLILWHANAKEIDPSKKLEGSEYRALKRRFWNLKTLVNKKCFDADHDDPHELNVKGGNRQRLLRELSSWLESELNGIARKHPSNILDRSLEFRHSFHEYPDEWGSKDPVPRVTNEDALLVLGNRWDEPEAA